MCTSPALRGEFELEEDEARGEAEEDASSGEEEDADNEAMDVFGAVGGGYRVRICRGSP